MEMSIKLQSDEIKKAIVKMVEESFGMGNVPADATLHIKFDDTTKNVTQATLTIKKD